MGHTDGQGTFGRTWDIRTDMGYKSGHGIQIGTWDTNPDTGYKSGHFRVNTNLDILQ